MRLFCLGAMTAPGINDAKDFEEFCDALLTIGVTEEQRVDIFRTLAIVLHLGNLSFAEGGSDGQVMMSKVLSNFQL